MDRWTIEVSISLLEVDIISIIPRSVFFPPNRASYKTSFQELKPSVDNHQLRSITTLRRGQIRFSPNLFDKSGDFLWEQTVDQPLSAIRLIRVQFAFFVHIWFIFVKMETYGKCRWCLLLRIAFWSLGVQLINSWILANFTCEEAVSSYNGCKCLLDNISKCKNSTVFVQITNDCDIKWCLLVSQRDSYRTICTIVD